MILRVDLKLFGCSPINSSRRLHIGFANSLTKSFEHTLIFVVCLVAILLDVGVVFSSELPVGIDGYYYLSEVNSLSHTGSLSSGSLTPVTRYYLTGLALLLGNPVAGIKIGAVSLHLLVSLGVAAIVRELTVNRLASIFSLIIVVFSGLHRYLIVEYVNYLGAIAFLTWTMYFGIRFIQNRNKQLFAFFGCVTYVFALGSHVAALPISLGFIVVFAISLILLSDTSFGNSKMVAIIAGMVLLFFVPCIISIQTFFPLPNEWSYEVSASPRFPATLSTFPDLLILLGSSALIFVGEFLFRLRISERIPRACLLALALTCVLVSLNPFISSAFGFATIGGRLRLLAYIQAAILVPGVVWLLSEKFKRIHWYVAIVVIPLMVWSFVNPLPIGAQPAYLERRERLIEGLKANSLQLGPNPIIIAPHGEQFVVTYVTGLPSQQRYPKEAGYDSVFWLLNLVPPTFIDSSMQMIAKDKVGSYTVLVKDGPEFRQRLNSPEVRQLLRAGNRHLDIYLANNGTFR